MTWRSGGATTCPPAWAFGSGIANGMKQLLCRGQADRGMVGARSGSPCESGVMSPGMRPALGWRARVPLDDGVDRMIEDLNAHWGLEEEVRP